MRYEEAELVNGGLKIVESRDIDQGQLTADCFLVQFRGLAACADCPAFNTKSCGGGKSLWAHIISEYPSSPAAMWAIQEAPKNATAKAIASGNFGTFGFVLKSLWRRYVRTIKDAKEGSAVAQAGGELSGDEKEELRAKVGHAAMVAGYRSNTFGGLYEKNGKLYILSLNTRTFRLCNRWDDWQGIRGKERRYPWLTETSAAAVRIALIEFRDHEKRSQRHLRFYYGETNAPTKKAREWAVNRGYKKVV